MENYMLLIQGDGSNKSPEKMQRQLQDYMAWMEKWKTRGQYVDGSPFKREGRHLKTKSDIASEGSFLDPVETIGGYIHIKASDIDNAVEIAQECPLIDGCGIFVRPFLTM